MKLLNLLDIQRYVKACASKARMNVVYEDSPVPYATPGCIHLPNLSKFTTEAQLAEYLYFVEHETAHATHTDFAAAKKYKEGSFSKRVLGMLEDYRVDNVEARDYDGFRMNRADVLPVEIDVMADSFSKFMASSPTPEQVDEAERLMSVHAWTTLNDETHTVSSAAEKLLANDNIIQWVYKLDKYSEELAALLKEGTEEAAQLADELVSKVFEQDASEDEEPEEGEEEGGEGSESKEGEGKEGKGKGDGKPKEGDGDKGKDGKSKGEGDGDEGFGNHFDHKSGIPQGIARGGKGAYEPKVTRDLKIECDDEHFHPCLPDQFMVADLSEGIGVMEKVITRSGYYVFGKGAAYVESEARDARDAVRSINSGTVEGFAQQVRRLLQIRARSRFEYGQKKGRLDQSRLARIGMRDAPGFNERIFKNKIVNDTTDTAVTVLLDASGSMHGSKWAHAIKSAELINATVSRALGIPLEVLAFTDDHVGSVIYEAKKFNQLRVGDEELLNRLSWATSYMSGNADGEAVLYAYQRLRQRKEKRRVLIVVSDGAPSCSREGDIDTFTKEVIEEIEADRHVDIYGLGLMSSSVRHYYKHHVVVSRGDSLEQALLTLIDKSIA